MAKQRANVEGFDKARSLLYSNDKEVVFCFVRGREIKSKMEWNIRATKNFRYYIGSKEVVCLIYRCADYNFISEYIKLEKGRGNSIMSDPFQISIGRDILSIEKFVSSILLYNPDILNDFAFKDYCQTIDKYFKIHFSHHINKKLEF